MLGSKHTIIFNNKKGKYIKQKRNRQNVKEYNWILNQDDDDENFFCTCRALHAGNVVSSSTVSGPTKY